MITGALKTKVYQFYESQLSKEVFEQWIYNNVDKIEQQLSTEDFITIIGHNFKTKFAKQEFFRAINHLIDWGDYETLRIKALLTDIIEKRENFGESLLDTYDLYCEGYDFFADLAFNGALDLMERHEFGLVEYTELTKKNQQQIIDKIHPRVLPLASKILAWINNDKIKLTGQKKGHYPRYEYFDYRPSNDLTSIESARKKAKIQSEQDKKDKSNSKKWWEFWKK